LNETDWVLGMGVGVGCMHTKMVTVPDQGHAAGDMNETDEVITNIDDDVDVLTLHPHHIIRSIPE
jgi:hypothetical protein